MRLAMESTVLTIDGYRFVLRPTLRAAARLEQIYGGWGSLAEAYAAYEIRALVDIVTECSVDGHASYDRLCKAIGRNGLKRIYDDLAAPITGHLVMLVGFDPEATEEPDSNPVSFTEYHETLFKIGTGWLGWTPEQTWNATAQEIAIARRGLIEKLRAIYAPAQPEASASTEISKEEFKALSSKRIGQRV